MGLFDLFRLRKTEEAIINALEKEFPEYKDNNELYDEIANNYVKLIKLLNIKSFNCFSFPDYDDCHIIMVDENKFDFDNVFSHNNAVATEAVCTIDCLLADAENDIGYVLREIEKRINSPSDK